MKEQIEIQNLNSRAAAPLLLFYIGGATSVAVGCLFGEVTSGVAASPFVGYGFVEFALTLPAWVRDKILPLLRTPAARAREEEAVRAKYRAREERAAEGLKIDQSAQDRYWERVSGAEVDNVYFHEK